MKRIFIFLVFALCVTAAVSSYAFAKCGSMDKCCNMNMQDKMWSKMDLDDKFFCKAHFFLSNAADLGLTDEQIEKIKTLKYSTKKILIKNKADIEILALDIEEGLRKDEIDVSAVNSLIDKKFTLKAQTAKELVEAFANLKKILTKDQIKKMKDIWSKGMCEMKNHKMHEMMEGKEEHKGKGVKEEREMSGRHT